MVKKTRKHKPHLGATLGDEHPEKLMPASVASLIAVIRQYWPGFSGDWPVDTVGSVEAYRTEPPDQFVGALNYTKGKLRGIRIQGSDPMQSIQKLESGNVPLHYWHLRLIAEWTGLSVSQLMMLTHFISIERRAEKANKDRISVLYMLVEEYERVIKEMRKIIDERSQNTLPALYTIVEGEKHSYAPDGAVLHRLSIAAQRDKHSGKKTN